MSKCTLGGVILVLGPVLFVVTGLLLESAEPLDLLRLSIQRTPGSLPSSRAVPDNVIALGVPVLSVYADSERLYDPAFGLLTNPRRGGREWEIPAMVSYFDHGRLVFASAVGFRVHGNNSGTTAREQSFRLHFRREYGGEQFMPGVLFQGRSDPITRLVVHKDRGQDSAGRWWHLVNPLAYDIARRLGADAPNTQPVRVLINGESLGVYALTEHVRQAFLRARFGHENFIRADGEIVEALRHAVDDISPLTMVEAARLIDVESLSRWFVSVIFCATTDPFQPVMFQDETRPDARWFWVAWDMDHSFMDLYGQASELWQHDTFETTLHQPALESEILTRLISEDPAYRDYLIHTVTDALNHHVTAEFLRERLEHYRMAGTDYELEHLEFLEILEYFLVLRPPEVRALLTRHAGAGPSHRFVVRVPEGVDLEVDGYRKSNGFRGWYFDGTDVDVRLTTSRSDFLHWLVNDRLLQTPDLRHRVVSDTTVTAVLSSD